MLSFKHLFRTFSNFDRARRSCDFALDKRLISSHYNRNPKVLRLLSYTELTRKSYSSYDKPKGDIPLKSSDKKKIQSFQECHAPNLMSSSPHPEKPFQEEYDKLKKRNMKIFYIGLATFLVATVGVYMNFQTEKPCKTKPHSSQVKDSKKKERIIPKNPSDVAQIPAKIPYLLIGGGTASFSAFRAIKSSDPTALVLMITDEPYLPYMRPPLSKEMWFNSDQDKVKKLIFKQWNGTERSLLYEPEEFYTPITELLSKDNGGISVASGYKVVEIDPYCRKVKLEDGYEIEYTKALLATGAQPKRMALFESAKNNPHVKHRVKYLRNIYDFEDLQESFRKSENVAVIGGGFLGSEIACSLARLGRDENKKVIQIFKENGNLGKVLPQYLSEWTTSKVINEGVHVVPNTEVVGCQYEESDRMLHLLLSNGETIRVEQVVLCTGVVPDTSLAEKAGLEIDPTLGGFLVNSELQARTDLFIAGDAACFYDPKLGRRRVEHHDHAVVTGRLAGENMTGAHKPYVHQSMFWSDLGPDIGFEAIGLVDSKLPTVGVFAKAKTSDSPKSFVTETDSEANRIRVEAAEVPPDCAIRVDKEDRKDIEVSSKTSREDMPGMENPDDFGKGVVFYLKNEKIVGIVLWNVFNRIQTARQVLKEDSKYDNLNEVAKLFNIHQET